MLRTKRSDRDSLASVLEWEGSVQQTGFKPGVKECVTCVRVYALHTVLLLHPWWKFILGLGDLQSPCDYTLDGPARVCVSRAMQSVAMAMTASLSQPLSRLMSVLMLSTDANAAALSTNSGLRTVTCNHRNINHRYYYIKRHCLCRQSLAAAAKSAVHRHCGSFLTEVRK